MRVSWTWRLREESVNFRTNAAFFRQSPPRRSNESLSNESLAPNKFPANKFPAPKKFLTTFMALNFHQHDLQRVVQDTFVEKVWYRPQMESTSDMAFQLARDAQEMPLLVLTQRQTAGRGRGTNQWWSGDGGLTFSIVLDASSDTASGSGWTQISLAAALAVGSALRQVLPGGDVGLKWPNDVFLGSRKVCGILVESRPEAPRRLVLGIGLNVNNSFRSAPPAVRELGTSLCDEAGRTFEPIEVLVAVLRNLETKVSELQEGRLALPRQWSPHCILSGHWVQVDTGSRQLLGRCRGIDDDGALLLDTESGQHRCYSGTVRRAEL
jgi:BirA family biotin operon repressor/biotin-[acetyl-CoA-carboxylase] ligase